MGKRMKNLRQFLLGTVDPHAIAIGIVGVDPRRVRMLRTTSTEATNAA